jgi:hypothetical protein
VLVHLFLAQLLELMVLIVLLDLLLLMVAVAVEVTVQPVHLEVLVAVVALTKLVQVTQLKQAALAILDTVKVEELLLVQVLLTTLQVAVALVLLVEAQTHLLPHLFLVMAELD